MMEFINSTSENNPVESMYAQVPMLRARKCHGKGMKLTMTARSERIGNKGNVGSEACMISLVASEANGGEKESYGGKQKSIGAFARTIFMAYDYGQCIE